MCYVVLFDGKSLSKKVTDAQTRTQSAYTSGPRDFNIKKEVFFGPDPANFPNIEGLYPDFPDIDKRYVSKGTWTGAEYSRFMHTAVELIQMDSDDLRLKACKYLVGFLSQQVDIENPQIIPASAKQKANLIASFSAIFFDNWGKFP